MHVLIVGGAGFIGSHIADALIARGDTVTALDNLDPQVHPDGVRPNYLHPEVRLIVGDVRDRGAVAAALNDVDAVIYNAAAVGVGQSMYKIDHYVDVNCRGAAIFWEEVLKKNPLKRMIVASSMSCYGEGAYKTSTGERAEPAPRTESDLANGYFEVRAASGEALQPIPTDESKRLDPSSIYAITKRDQEEMFLALGRTYGIPVTAFRYFNVIGSRQALSNPYTGVAAIFCSRLMNGNPPLVFEDGQQKRDFVHVGDIVQANLLALDGGASANDVFNIGSGQPITILEVGEEISRALGSSIRPEVTRKVRAGDIRHCYADIGKARRVLGYEPRYSIKDSIAELVPWIRSQVAVDQVDRSMEELRTLELLK